MAAMPASANSDRILGRALDTIPEELFQLPPELVWERTFLVSRKVDRGQHFRSKSAPAAFRTLPSQHSLNSGIGSSCAARICGGDSEQLCDNQGMREDAPSADSFSIGDIVAATSEFCIGGVLAVEKGCRGTVVSHGERPDGSTGVFVQFEARKDGIDANVSCRPQEIQFVRCASQTKFHAQPRREYVTLLEHHLACAWASIRSAISLSNIIWAIFLGIVATCTSSLPAAEKVIIEGTEVYSEMAGHALLNQCVSFTRNYLKINSKKHITVCGTQTKVILFLRNDCVVYSNYQHEIGMCNVAEASNTCLTASYQHEGGTCNVTEESCVTASPATEKGLRWFAQAQSYRIEQCSTSIGFWNMLWQRLLHICVWLRTNPLALFASCVILFFFQNCMGASYRKSVPHPLQTEDTQAKDDSATAASADVRAKVAQHDEETFAIIVRMLSGKAYKVDRLTANTPLATLMSKVATITGRKKHSLRLCLGSDTFEQAQLASKLATLGFSEGVEVTVLFRKQLSKKNLGVSMYNSEYRCTVLSVQEVGCNQLQIRFRAVGRSLGRLQDPRYSKLSEVASSSAGKNSERHYYRLSAHRYDKCDMNSCIEGTLTFEDVKDLHGKCLYFRYGSSGYSELPLNFDDTDMIGEDADS